MKKALLLVSGWLLMAWAGAQAQEAPVLPSLQVGVETTSYFPYYDHDDRNNYLGITREILDLFAQQSKREVVYVMLPIKRLFADFLAGQLDFKFPDNALWQPELKKGVTITYSDPVVGYVDGMMVRPENQGKPISAFKVLGTMRGFTPYDYLEYLHNGTLKMEEKNTFTGLLEQAILQRVDGAYINIYVARYQLEERLKKPGALVFDPSLPHSREFYRLSSIKYPQVIEEFNRFLQANQAKLETLKKKYKID